MTESRREELEKAAEKYASSVAQLTKGGCDISSCFWRKAKEGFLAGMQARDGEVEQLKKDNTSLLNEILNDHKASEECAKLRAENERMKAALREIIRLDQFSAPDHLYDGDFAKIARQALAQPDATSNEERERK